MLAAMEEHQMDTRERVAYLLGLARAQAADGRGDSQLLTGILEVLADLAREVSQLRAGERTLSSHVRSLRGHLAELAGGAFNGADFPDTALVHCEACGQAMRVLTADLSNDQVELVCPTCGHVVHAYDPGLDYDEDEDTLEDLPEGDA